MQSTNNKTPHLGTGGGAYGEQLTKYTHKNLWYFKPEEFARRQSSIKLHWNVVSCPMISWNVVSWKGLFFHVNCLTAVS